MELSEYLQKKQYYYPPSVPPIEDLEWEYDRNFDYWLKTYPEDQHAEIRERLRYIKLHVSKDLDFDGEEWSIPTLAMSYYEKRSEILNVTYLSEDEFDNLAMLQTAIANLGLSPKPTFELIVFLWHIISQWEDNRQLRLGIKLRNVVKRIDDYPDDKVSLEIKIGAKHFSFDNGEFVKAMIATYLNYDNKADLIEETVNTRRRELDYILVRTLLNSLPIEHKKEKKGTFSQAERDFCLGVLWLNAGINHKPNDDPELKCCNAIFDQLIRNNKNTRLPVVMPSLLTRLRGF